MNDSKCSTRLIINWLGVIAVLALGSAVGLSIFNRNDATTIVTIIGITASVASGFIGYLGGRASQQTINTGPTGTTQIGSEPTTPAEQGG